MLVTLPAPVHTTSQHTRLVSYKLVVVPVIKTVKQHLQQTSRHIGLSAVSIGEADVAAREEMQRTMLKADSTVMSALQC